MASIAQAGTSHCPRITRYRKSRQRHAALEEQVAALQRQVTQLHLNNKQLQLHHGILEQVCEVTSLLLQLLAQHGPVLEGPSYRGAEGSVRAAVVQLEGYVWDLLGTNPAEQPPRQPLPAPQYHVASLDDTMAAAVMDGSCLSLVRYALAAVAANPEAYAHVSFVTPQDRHAALAKLYEDVRGMLVRDSDGSCSHSSSSSSDNNSSSAAPAATGPGPLLTVTSSRLAPGVTPQHLAQRLLQHVVVGVLGHVMNAPLPFMVQLTTHLQLPSSSFWRAITAALGLSQQQVDGIVAATAAHEQLQEQLRGMQEALLHQVDLVLADARSCADRQHAQATPAQPQQQQQQPWVAHNPPGPSGSGRLPPDAAALLVHHRWASIAGFAEAPCSSATPGAVASRPGAATAAAAAGAGVAALSGEVPLLSPAAYEQLEALCDRLAAVARKLAWLAACTGCHITGCLTVRQAGVFVINTHPYPIPVNAWARWLHATAAQEGPAALAAAGDGQQLLESIIMEFGPQVRAAAAAAAAGLGSMSPGAGLHQGDSGRAARQAVAAHSPPQQADTSQQQLSGLHGRGEVVGPVGPAVPPQQHRASPCSYTMSPPGQLQPAGSIAGDAYLLPAPRSGTTTISNSSSKCARHTSGEVRPAAAHGLRQEAEAGGSVGGGLALPVWLEQGQQQHQGQEQQHQQLVSQQQQQQQQGLAQAREMGDVPASGGGPYPTMQALLTLLTEPSDTVSAAAGSSTGGSRQRPSAAPQPPVSPPVGQFASSAVPAPEVAMLSEQELDQLLDWLVALPEGV